MWIDKKGSKFIIACILPILAVVSIATMTSCRHNPPNTSPQVVFTQSLLSGSQAVLLVSDGLVTANAAFDQLRKAGTIEDENFNKGKDWLNNIAQANDKAIAAIRLAQTGDTSTDWKAALLAVTAAAGQTDPSTFGFKNPDTQAAVKVSIASLQLAIAVITNTWGGSK